jgi:hypothetical protein
MLTKAKALKGFRLSGLDDQIGSVREFYFDDQKWTIRYLVADVGNWLTGSQVLISPYAIRGVYPEVKQVAVALTRKQITNAPSVESDKPVSREFEWDYHAYYGYPAYWIGPYNWGAYPSPGSAYGYQGSEDATGHPSNEPINEPDHHLRSTADVTGHQVQASDGDIGHIADFIIDTETWCIRYFVVDTGDWWPGTKVMMSTKWISRVSWSESKVFINVTREGVKNSPELSDESLFNRNYEAALHRHYGRQGYWVDEDATDRKAADDRIRNVERAQRDDVQLL